MAAAVFAAGVALPWLTVEGLPLRLDAIGVRARGAATTVSGFQTDVWLPFVAVAALIAVLGWWGLPRAPRLARFALGALGLLGVLVASGLAYYAANLVELELRDRSGAEQALAQAAVSSSPEAGLAVLAAGAVLAVVAALIPFRRGEVAG